MGSVKMLKRVKMVTDRMSEVLAALSGVAIFAIVSVVAYSTISRYAFNRSVHLMEELSGLLLMASCFLVFPFVFAKGMHIKVTLLTSKVPSKARMYMEVVAGILAFLFLILFVKLTYDFTYESYLLGARTWDARLYVVPWMAVMPVGGAIFAIVVLVFCIEKIGNIVKKTEQEPEEIEIKKEERMF